MRMAVQRRRKLHRRETRFSPSRETPRKLGAASPTTSRFQPVTQPLGISRHFFSSILLLDSVLLDFFPDAAQYLAISLCLQSVLRHFCIFLVYLCRLLRAMDLRLKTRLVITSAKSRPRLDNVELDLGRYELRRFGRRVKLEKKPMELLIFLVKR